MRGGRVGWAGTTFLIALAVAPAEHAAGQSPEMFWSGPESTVRMTYAARPDVRVCPDGVRRTSGPGEHGRPGERGSTGLEACRAETVEVEATVRNGRVASVDVLLLDETPAEDGRDLGRVPVDEAIRFLLSVARGGTTAAAEAAIHAVVLADSVEVWSDLLDLARDRERPGRVRKIALFWLGQETATALTAGLVATSMDEREEQDVRDAAVFALSRRPSSESVPALMELATTAPGRDTRRSALFWLAQSEDPRVPGFFAALLRESRGG